MPAYEITFGMLGTALFWSGIQLFFNSKQQSLTRTGSVVLLAMGGVFLAMFIADYFLPKPISFEFEGWWVMLILGFIVIALHTATWIFYSLGNTGLRKWIPVLIYGVSALASWNIFIVGLNNVPYSGCYPTVPVGTKCPCEYITEPVVSDTVNHSMRIPVFQVDTSYLSEAKDAFLTSEESATIALPKGGSLCKTLGMTRPQALKFAIANNMKHWEKNDVLFVAVFPGDAFIKTADGWELAK